MFSKKENERKLNKQQKKKKKCPNSPTFHLSSLLCSSIAWPSNSDSLEQCSLLSCSKISPPLLSDTFPCVFHFCRAVCNNFHSELTQQSWRIMSRVPGGGGEIADTSGKKKAKKVLHKRKSLGKKKRNIEAEQKNDQTRLRC